MGRPYRFVYKLIANNTLCTPMRLQFVCTRKLTNAIHIIQARMMLSDNVIVDYITLTIFFSKIRVKIKIKPNEMFAMY